MDFFEDENKKLLQDVFKAYYRARKNKRNTKTQLDFEINLENNLIELYHEIKNRTWRPSPSICFIVNFPVKREVFASQFKDRIVHHLLFTYIAPIFELHFIHDSYSCRKEKGTLFGINRLDHHIRSCSDNYSKQVYVLKLDIQGYFMNINKQKLYEIVCRKLYLYWCKHKEDDLDRELIDYIVKTTIFNLPVKECIFHSHSSEWDGLPASKSLIKVPNTIGLPIGDLTSQLFSNIYLGELDNYIKRTLSLKHYGRYVDDFFVVHHSKAYLKKLIKIIDAYCKDILFLNIHPNKIHIQPHQYGVQFLGAIVKPHRKYLIHRTVGQIKRVAQYANIVCRADNLEFEKLSELRSVLNSYCGHSKFYKTYIMKNKLFSNSNLNKYFHINENISKMVIQKKHIKTLKERTNKMNNIIDIIRG